MTKDTIQNIYNLLVELIKKDREDISAIIERISKVLQWFILASFAISAFFIKPLLSGDGNNYSLGIAIGVDIILLILSISFAYFMYNELHFLRKNMEMREDLINSYLKTETFPDNINPYQIEVNRITRIKDYGVIISILIVALIYISKIIALLFLFCCK